MVILSLRYNKCIPYNTLAKYVSISNSFWKTVQNSATDFGFRKLSIELQNWNRKMFSAFPKKNVAVRSSSNLTSI